MSNEIKTINITITPEAILAVKEKLENGDIELMLDLEGDTFADPDSDNVAYGECYAQVVGVEQETPECIVVHFEGSPSVGFPVNHVLTVGVFFE